MEEKKILKISLSTFFLIIAIIIILVMAYFIWSLEKQISNLEVYVKAGSMSEVSNASNAVDQEVHNTTDSNNQETEEGLEDNNSLKETKVTTNNYELYKKNYESTYKNIIGQNDEIATTELKDKVPGIMWIGVNNKGEAYAIIDNNSNLKDKYDSKFKVTSNVANVYVCSIGNGGLSDVIFVYKDGTAAKISGSDTSNGKILLQTIKEAKNVVTVVPVTESEDGMTGGNNYYLIDINGNKINS